MALDEHELIETANPAAEQILGLALKAQRGRPLAALAKASSQLEPFADGICEAIRNNARGGRAEITLYREGGRQVLLCRHSPLQINAGRSTGHVLVFDDVTELVRAQRDAAWGEVARRLAHEIKNPLTPIQLAAERVRRKYLGKMDAEEGDVLNRATSTIVQQVEALKTMVNEFSDYARPCKMEPRPMLVDNFVGEVVALYEDTQSHVVFLPDAPEAAVEGDPVRLRQVLHNLIKNGHEALPDGEGEVRVSTCIVEHGDRTLVQICVEDSGSGFDPELIDQVFEPYVTSKRKGTGLGLAIVKRIIGEHGGNIRADNRSEGGARMTISLPLRHTHEVLENNDPMNKEQGAGV
jgi:PAS domain S-box-containing protein